MVHKEVVRPGDIAKLKHDLIEAVTNAYMMKHIPQTTELYLEDQGEHKSGCNAGEFRFKMPSQDNILGFSLERDTGYYVSYPGGHWKEDVSAGRDYGSREIFDAKGIYSMVEEKVGDWLDPWINDCHSPNEFTNQIASLANVAGQLYIGNEVVFSESGSAGVDDPPKVTSAVSDVRSAIDEIDLQVDSQGGAAINAFQRTYSKDIARTIGGQRGLASAACVAITAEAVAWNEAFTTLRDFVLSATHDFNDYANAHGSGGKALEATLGATSAITGLAGATVGLAFPPFGAAMGVVGGIAGVASLMFPATEAVNPQPITLSGGSYMEYWESFKDGITAISDDLLKAEAAISSGCRRILSDYRTNTDNYSLTQGQQGPYDDLDPFLNVEIKLKYVEWKKVAGAVESIGDHQRDLAKILGGTDGAGNPSALVSSEWGRGTLPSGTIGSGSTGPYDEFKQVVDAITDLLLVESKTSHEVAVKCMDMAHDFQATDQEIEKDLNKHAKKFDTVAIPVVNAPPPPPVGHGPPSSQYPGRVPPTG